MILEVNTSMGSYDITIEKGLLDGIGKYVSKLIDCKLIGCKKIFVITDKNVESFHGKKIKKMLKNEGFEVFMHVIEPGEKNKNIHTLSEIYSKLADKRISRSDLIISFGGGVVGDISGFAASTYLRGIDYIQIPTTLLSQVDSSVGGKTAIDIQNAKNMVGSFYQPKAVFIDPNILKTLDSRYFKDGMAEVIKYGMIRDKVFFDFLNKCEGIEFIMKNIGKIIYTCCKIKRDIVQNDEYDKDERMLLNFGHTIGHAIETYYNYEKYTHGEAVALGMAWITSIAYSKGDVEYKTLKDLESILTKHGLPINYEDIKIEHIIRYIKNDKKNYGDILKVILVDKIGEGKIVEKDINYFKKNI